jgi:hypothetical protein
MIIFFAVDVISFESSAGLICFLRKYTIKK